MSYQDLERRLDLELMTRASVEAFGRGSEWWGRFLLIIVGNVAWELKDRGYED